MNSLYHAYEAYERRVIRGELLTIRRKPVKSQTAHEPWQAQVGDVLIHTGLWLKRHYATNKPLAWTQLTGIKP